MYSILETVFLSKELHQSLLAPVCDKYELTYTEIVVLLYVASHPENNTATDVVNNRRLTKSAVSMAVHSLKEKGLLQGDFEGGNHRTVHLKLFNKADDIVAEGMEIQRKYISVMTDGFTLEEIEMIETFFNRISVNIKDFENKNKNRPTVKEKINDKF